jgi:TRAP-type C4-dicarboxylate transport system permease small subunit
MYQQIDKWSCRAAGFLLFCLMFLTFFDVAGRNLINRPINGTSELTEIGLASIIFMMLPRVAIAGQHIVIDLIDGISGPRLRMALDAFGAVLGAVMFFLIAWQVWIMGGKAAAYDDLTPTLRIPVGPVLYAMALFSGVVGAAFLISLANAVRGVVPQLQGSADPIVEHPGV